MAVLQQVAVKTSRVRACVCTCPPRSPPLHVRGAGIGRTRDMTSIVQRWPAKGCRTYLASSIFYSKTLSSPRQRTRCVVDVDTDFRPGTVLGYGCLFK